RRAGDAPVVFLHPLQQPVEVRGHERTVAGIGEGLDPLDVQVVERLLAGGVDVDRAARRAADEPDSGAMEEVAGPVRLAGRTVHEAVVGARRPHRRGRSELERPHRAVGPGHRRPTSAGCWRSFTKGLASRKDSVSTMLSSMLLVGAQPSARSRVVSRRIRGESPTQPRSPPAWTIRGFTPRVRVITAMLWSTSIQSWCPRLKRLMGSLERARARSMPLTQSPTWR